MSLWTIVGVIAVVVLVIAVVNRQALRDFFGAARTQIGNAGRAVRNADPLGNYQQQIDDATGRIKSAKEGMRRAVALIKSVGRQVATGKQEQARLTARIEGGLAEVEALRNNDQAALRQIDPALTRLSEEERNKKADLKEAKVNEWALQLASVEANLKTNEGQLENQQQQYDTFAADVRREQEATERAKQDAAQLGVQLELSGLNKEFNEWRAEAGKFTGSANGFASAREGVLRQIDTNNAGQQVEADTGGAGGGPTDEEVDRQLAANEILKRFRKETPANV